MTPSPFTSGASSLPSNSHCMPRQIPSSGLPVLGVSGDGLVPGTLEGGRGREVADAGHDDAAGVGEDCGCLGHDEVRAEERQRLLDGRQVAGAVVDQRNHSSPLVLGSILARRSSREQATRSARANALNTASMW